jgi:hypothetical protein
MNKNKLLHEGMEDETLDELVEVAAVLSVTANSEATRHLAACKRAEAYQALADLQIRIAGWRAVLDYFPFVEVATTE